MSCEAVKTGRKSVVLEKAKAFAVRIVKMALHIRKTKKDFILSDQVFRSGTSIGANLSEAVYASSRKDFRNKHAIALKECAETLFWLDLLHETGFLAASAHRSMRADCEELRKILVSITKTVSATPAPQPPPLNS